MKSKLFLYKSALVAALAGFLFGFDTVVISGAEQTIQNIWNLGSSLHGLAISMALWGTVLGAMIGGLPTEKWGRRKTLIAIGTLYLISALGSAFAPEVYSFMLSSFIRWSWCWCFNSCCSAFHFRNCSAKVSWKINRNVSV